MGWMGTGKRASISNTSLKGYTNPGPLIVLKTNTFWKSFETLGIQTLFGSANIGYPYTFLKSPRIICNSCTISSRESTPFRKLTFSILKKWDLLESPGIPWNFRIFQKKCTGVKIKIPRFTALQDGEVTKIIIS